MCEDVPKLMLGVDELVFNWSYPIAPCSAVKTYEGERADDW
ncbi:hypothetical protein [Pedobacter sp. SG908]|nr:hypothetical protein [Pedobacter sp. SG908]NII81237.1 hypothetical protein [Pedobacter sp. SG908]